MHKKIYQASAPGSLMLFGEHAVLHDKQAIVCAINKRLKVTLSLRTDRQININSDKLGNFTSSLDNLEIQQPFHFVLGTIKYFIEKFSAINFGFDLRIESEFAKSLGLGSSAAVIVATLKVLHDCYSSSEHDLMDLFFAARNIVREVQGVGSGADIAASIFGGIVSYKMSPCSIDKIGTHLPLIVIYSGSKVPTKDVIQKVNKLQKKHPDIFPMLYRAMEKCAVDAVTAIKNNDLHRLGELMNIHQGLQDALGVNNAILSELIYELRDHKHILGAKISGSGLGDCVIGLGEMIRDHFPRNNHEIQLNIKQIDASVVDIGLNVD